jgi:hypothetical protein
MTSGRFCAVALHETSCARCRGGAGGRLAARETESAIRNEKA